MPTGKRGDKMAFQATIEGDVIREYASARAVVERVLAEIPRTRDMFDDEFREYISSYCLVCELPAIPFETIRRVRQKIQNSEGKYPASESVRAIRQKREEAIRRNIKYI
jgi:hypothetical protein